MTDLPVSATGRAAEDVARSCAREASQIIIERFSQRRQVRIKGRGNVVTETDLAVEKAVLATLREHFPDHAVLSEETAAPIEPAKQGWLWVVDPLDGTYNYSRGIPNFAFNIALCADGSPVLALTCAPVTGDEFFARKRGGLFLNGEPATASSAASLQESVVGGDLGYDDARGAKLVAVISELWPGVQGLRVMGSAALGLAFAASGRLDIFVHPFVFPWDIAAGILLVQEGGGTVVDRGGGPATIYSEGVIAGAPAAVREFLERFGNRPWR